MKGHSLTYDKANNIIQKNNDVFQYDLLNQLLYANLRGNFELDKDEETQRVDRVKEDYGAKLALEFTVSEPEIIELDYAAGSIGVDLMAPVAVTRIELEPNNPVHRMNTGNFRVYVSGDNISYTKVEGWKLAPKEKGRMEIVFSTPLTARYLKVKSLFDERDEKYEAINRASFKNLPNDMITVFYLLGNRLEEYTYDKIGNRKTETITQRNAVSRTYEYYDKSSRLKKNGKYYFEYDPNGNLVKKETLIGEKISWLYQYDLLNRLEKVTKNDTVVAEYAYDEAGSRVKKNGKESDTYYVFDAGGNVLYEQENREYLEYVYVLGKHFARVNGNLDNGTGKKYFYHMDHLGSTVAVIDD